MEVGTEIGADLRETAGERRRKRNAIGGVETKIETKTEAMNTMTGTREDMMTAISGEDMRKKNENQRKIKSATMRIIVRRKKRNPSGTVRMTIGRRREKRNTKSLTNLVEKTGMRMNMKRDRQGAREETRRRMKGILKDLEEQRRAKFQTAGMLGMRRETTMRVERRDMWMATIEDIE